MKGKADGRTRAHGASSAGIAAQALAAIQLPHMRTRLHSRWMTLPKLAPWAEEIRAREEEGRARRQAKREELDAMIVSHIGRGPGSRRAPMRAELLRREGGFRHATVTSGGRAGEKWIESRY